MLKMSLNEIRGQIQIFPESWINLTTTNCYAYALGLDINENKICDFAYQPGTISGIFDITRSEEYFSHKILTMGIETDLEALDILYREIDPKDDIDDDEWKVALMVEYYDKSIFEGLLSNFHFLRTNKNGMWIHKASYLDDISKKDDLGEIITDPRDCNLFSYEYSKCYALKLHNK